MAKEFHVAFQGFVGDVRRATSISSFRRLEQRIPAACIHGIFEENENAHATLATNWRISPCIGKYPGDSPPPILPSIVVSSKPRFQLEIIRTVSLEKKSGKVKCLGWRLYSYVCVARKYGKNIEKRQTCSMTHALWQYSHVMLTVCWDTRLWIGCCSIFSVDAA